MDPPFCPIRYTCTTTLGTLNPSSLPCTGPYTTLDPITAKFTVKFGIDKWLVYPPGKYYYTVTGTVKGLTTTNTQTIDFVLRLKDLCIEDVKMTLNTSQFVNKVYILS